MYFSKLQALLGITDDQILLLKSALLDSNEALIHFQLWKEYYQFDKISKNDNFFSIINKIDSESLRLLPLIFRKIEHSNDSLLPVLKELYRKTWMKNHQFLKKSQEIITLCNEENIPTMLLKGIPLALVYYKDLGVRPMGDVDLLVPLTSVDRTVELLSKLGHAPELIEERYRDYIHAMHCYDPNGWDVDLHWQVFFFQDKDSESIQTDAMNRQEISLSDSIKTEVLNDSLQFFHVIIHGLLEGKGIIRWIVDAVTILQSDRIKIDYEFLNRFSVRTNTEHVFKLGLQFIEEVLGKSIFTEVLVPSNKSLKPQINYLKLTKWAPFSVVGVSLRMVLRSYFHCILFRRDMTMWNQFTWFWGMLRLRLAQSK